MRFLAVILTATVPEVSTFAVTPLLRLRSLVAHSSGNNAAAPPPAEVVSNAESVHYGVTRRSRSILRVAAGEPDDSSASSAGGVWNDMEILVEIKGGIKVSRRCIARRM